MMVLGEGWLRHTHMDSDIDIERVQVWCRDEIGRALATTYTHGHRHRESPSLVP